MKALVGVALLLVAADVRAELPTKPVATVPVRLPLDPCSVAGVKAAPDVNARIEQCVAQGTQWVRSQPDSETTWAMVRMSIANYLYTLWQGGVLVGTKPEQAFFVRCDRTTMTQNDLDAHRLVALYGIARIKPAELDVLRLVAQTA